MGVESLDAITVKQVGSLWPVTIVKASIVILLLEQRNDSWMRKNDGNVRSGNEKKTPLKRKNRHQWNNPRAYFNPIIQFENWLHFHYRKVMYIVHDLKRRNCDEI